MKLVTDVSHFGTKIVYIFTKLLVESLRSEYVNIEAVGIVTMKIDDLDLLIHSNFKLVYNVRTIALIFSILSKILAEF